MKLLKASALMAVLLVCAVLMLGVLSLRVHLVRGAGTTAFNGDVNCDGKVDIADAISIIQWQFFGGSEPCALAEDPAVIDKLNALGNQITDLQNSVAALAPTWPPKAEDSVSVTAQGNDSDAGVTAYKVPDGKTFVLTNLTVARGDGSSEIWEVAGGKSTLKWHKSNVPYVSSTGIRFASGSTVLFKLLDPHQSCSPGPCGVTYSFAGYIAESQ